MKALEEFLRPEFINRVDEVICFNKLTEEHFRDIAAIMLGELRDSLAEKAISITWDDSVLDYLTKTSYSATYGARNLRRTIQKQIEDRVAQTIIDHFEEPVSNLALTTDENGIVIDAR
jgi:ATP-dependent Clp protease ATP-binding subunit ClpB